MDRIALRPTRAETESAFAAYHDLYSHGSTVDRTRGLFRAEVQALRLPRLLLFDRRLAGVSHARDARRVRRDGFDHVTLQLVIGGAMTLFVGDTARPVGPGQLALFDTTQPQRTVTAGAHVLTAALPRDALDPVLRRSRDLHGLVLDAGRAPALIECLRGLGTSLARQGPAADGASETVGDLLNASLTLSPGRGALAPAAVRARARVAAFVEDHLADRHLTVSAVAAGVGVSRSALYRILETEGGVESFLQRRRLLHLRRLLARPGEARPLDALAAAVGLGSASHAVRLFRAAFGPPPGAFRLGTMRARDSADGEAVRAEFVGWHAEVL